MKSVVYCIAVFLIFCVGCKKKQGNDIEVNSNTTVLDSTSKEKIKVSLLALSPEAKKELEDFEDFQHLSTLLQTMRNSNPYYVQKYADSVKSGVMAFSDNRSARLKVNAIDSRITVLSTRSALLSQHAQKQTVDSKTLLDANEELIKGYNSLVIQLNELALAIPDNIREELLQDSEIVRDTIL